MLPQKELKLINNTGFKQLVLSSIGRHIKTELDRLTVDATPSTVADEKLLEWLRNIMRNGGIQDISNPLQAKSQHVAALLSMFDDTSGDDITYSQDDESALVVDWDASKPILITKIKDNNYFYGLAACTKEDFETAVS